MRSDFLCVCKYISVCFEQQKALFCTWTFFTYNMQKKHFSAALMKRMRCEVLLSPIPYFNPSSSSSLLTEASVLATETILPLRSAKMKIRFVPSKKVRKLDANLSAVSGCLSSWISCLKPSHQTGNVQAGSHCGTVDPGPQPPFGSCAFPMA
jgi:hypothetical protein